MAALNLSASVSTIGIFYLHSTDLLSMLKETGFDDKHIKCITRMLACISVQSIYTHFAKEEKNGTIQSFYLSNHVFVTFVFASVTLPFLNLDL